MVEASAGGETTPARCRGSCMHADMLSMSGGSALDGVTYPWCRDAKEWEVMPPIPDRVLKRNQWAWAAPHTW